MRHAARWRSEIERVRTQRGDHVERDASYWRKTLEEAPEEHREMVRGMMADEMRDRVDRAAARAGITDVRDPAYEALPEFAEATRLVDIATGKLVPLGQHLEEYLATLRNERKTVDMKRSTVEVFCKDFPYVADIQRKAVQRWLNRFVQDGKPATAQRALSELRGYGPISSRSRQPRRTAYPSRSPPCPSRRRTARRMSASPSHPLTW